MRVKIEMPKDVKGALVWMQRLTDMINDGVLGGGQPEGHRVESDIGVVAALPLELSEEHKARTLVEFDAAAAEVAGRYESNSGVQEAYLAYADARDIIV